MDSDNNRYRCPDRPYRREKQPILLTKRTQSVGFAGHYFSNVQMASMPLQGLSFAKHTFTACYRQKGRLPSRDAGCFSAAYKVVVRRCCPVGDDSSLTQNVIEQKKLPHGKVVSCGSVVMLSVRGNQKKRYLLSVILALMMSCCIYPPAYCIALFCSLCS